MITFVINFKGAITMPNVTMEEIIERYKQLYTGLIYDILETMGFPKQALANDIKPLRQDMMLAGPAFTVKGSTDVTGDGTRRERILRMWPEMRYPCVEVRDCNLDQNVAHFGELNATLSRKHGAVGAVIDGGTRDSNFILKMDYPVFTRYQNPVEAFRRWSVREWQIPVAIRGALATMVIVNPGDFVFGDIDGVVIVPKEIVMDVLLQAEEIRIKENMSRDEFKSGKSPIEVFNKFGRL
jgi:4-hydroxy-4-methyl-2-oxoglutarate aldolase